jgi:hypothetical protein
LNYEHPFPRVSGYSRVYDIMKVDITEFRMYYFTSIMGEWQKKRFPLVGHKFTLMLTSNLSVPINGHLGNLNTYKSLSNKEEAH